MKKSIDLANRIREFGGVMTRHTQRQRAKARLKTLGVTQSVAARELGVSFEHLNRVLNGHRESARLIRQILGMKISKP